MCPEMQPARNPGTLYAEHSHRKSTQNGVYQERSGCSMAQEVNLQELIESLDMVGIPWVAGDFCVIYQW